MIFFAKTAYTFVLAMIAVASAGAVAVANPEANPAADTAQNNMLKRAPCGCGGCGNNWGWGWNSWGGVGRCG
ncbi:hypothetical protein LPJ75_003707, partial [Coemansia sp. RSA 2598]